MRTCETWWLVVDVVLVVVWIFFLFLHSKDFFAFDVVDKKLKKKLMSCEGNWTRMSWVAWGKTWMFWSSRRGLERLSVSFGTEKCLNDLKIVEIFNSHFILETFLWQKKPVANEKTKLHNKHLNKLCTFTSLITSHYKWQLAPHASLFCTRVSLTSLQASLSCPSRCRVICCLLTTAGVCVTRLPLSYTEHPSSPREHI